MYTSCRTGWTLRVKDEVGRGRDLLVLPKSLKLGRVSGTSRICGRVGSERRRNNSRSIVLVAIHCRSGDLLLPDLLELFDVPPSTHHVHVDRIGGVRRRVACCSRVHPALDHTEHRDGGRRDLGKEVLVFDVRRRRERKGGEVERVQLRVVEEEAGGMERVIRGDVDDVGSVEGRVEVNVEDDCARGGRETSIVLQVNPSLERTHNPVRPRTCFAQCLGRRLREPT